MSEMDLSFMIVGVGIPIVVGFLLGSLIGRIYWLEETE